MAHVTFRVHRILSEGVAAESPALKDIPVSFAIGESLKHVVGRLATDDDTLGKALCDGNAPTIRSGILVVLNDRIINRSEYDKVVLQGGDEVAFLPILDGG